LVYFIQSNEGIYIESVQSVLILLF